MNLYSLICIFTLLFLLYKMRQKERNDDKMITIWILRHPASRSLCIKWSNDANENVLQSFVFEVCRKTRFFNFSIYINISLLAKLNEGYLHIFQETFPGSTITSIWRQLLSFFDQWVVTYWHRVPTTSSKSSDVFYTRPTYMLQTLKKTWKLFKRITFVFPEENDLQRMTYKKIVKFCEIPIDQ